MRNPKPKLKMTSKGPPSLSSKPLCLLSLDGGGIRGLSELLILGEIVHRVERRLGCTEPLVPSELFHVIGGTSTGGLVALLLGRLRLSIPEAISYYNSIAQEVFSTRKASWKDGRYKASALENAIKAAVKRKLGSSHGNDSIRFPNKDNTRCKVFVCAVAAAHLSNAPTLFRTWEASRNPGHDCTIWEAARATSAAPRLFKRIAIGTPLSKVEYVDGALGCNNPTKFVIKEAMNEFDDDRPVACILSIGTGLHHAPGFDQPARGQRWIPTELIGILARLVTDSTKTSDEISAKFHSAPGLYHRLNAGPEMGDVPLDEWKRLGEVEAHTEAYLRRDNIHGQLEVIVDAILGLTKNPISLRLLGDSVSIPHPEHRILCYPESRINASNFKERKEMKEIDWHFETFDQSPSQLTLVLYGMGGSGKSQLAHYYCRRAASIRTFGGVLWIDGTTTGTANQSMTKAARMISTSSASVEDWATDDTRAAVFAAIQGSKLPWLLVLDNYDDPTAYDIEQILPHPHSHMTIITSRHKESKKLGLAIEIGRLEKGEALAMLFGNDNNMGVGTSQGEKMPLGAAIVERLGYLPLAIAQAGAYISSRNMDLRYFLQHYEAEYRRILDKVPSIWQYSRTIPGGEEERVPLSIATTWELSLNLLSGDEVTKRAKICLLMTSAFLGRTFVSEDLLSAYVEKNQQLPDWMRVFVSQDNRLDSFILKEAIAEFGSLYLIDQFEINSKGAKWRFHPVVQDWALSRRPSKETTVEYTLLAADILQSSLKEYSPSWLIENVTSPSRNNYKSLWPHLEACFNNCEKNLPPLRSLGTATTAVTALKFASFFREAGRYTLAESLQRKVIREHRPEAENHTMAKRQLARTFIATNDLVQAAQIQEEVVGPLSRALDDTDNLDSSLKKAELAFIYQEQITEVGSASESAEKFENSVKLARSALKTISLHDSPDGLAAAGIMRVLADAMYHHKDYSEAKALEEKIVEIRTKHLGMNHLNTLDAKDSLAITMVKLGQCNEAAEMHKDIRDLRITIQGASHTKTIDTEVMLARAWREGGRLEEARQLNEEILQRAEAAFGPDQYDTQVAALGLWRTLMKGRHLERAGQLRQEYNLKLNDAEKMILQEALQEMGSS